MDFNNLFSNYTVDWTKCEKDFIKEDQVVNWIFAMICAFFSLCGSGAMLYTSLDIQIARGYDRTISYFKTNDDEEAYTHAWCVIFRGWFQISSSSTVCWTACISIYIYLVIFKRAFYYRNSTKITVLFHIFCWGLPIVCFIIILASNSLAPMKSLGVCFPKPPYSFYVWFFPNLVVYIFTLTMYFIILIKLRMDIKTQEDTESSSISGSTNQKWKRNNSERIELSNSSAGSTKSKVGSVSLGTRATLYLVAYFISWAFYIATFTVDFFDGCKPFWMVLAYVITLNSQGFLDTIVYGFTNKEFRKNFLGTKTPIVVLIFFLSPIIVWYKIVVFIKIKLCEIWKSRDGGCCEDTGSI